MKFPTYGEYKRLFKKAERILDREVVKPLGKRDDTLIKECEETMLFCIERMNALRPEVEEASARSRLRGLRLPQTRLARAAIAFCAVLLILAVTASVGQAFGVKFWSALVHWDRNYLRIDRTENGGGLPTDADIGTPGISTEAASSVSFRFDSEAELEEHFKGELLMPCASDLCFVSALVTENEVSSIIHTRYLLGDREVILDAILLPQSDGSGSSLTSKHDEAFSDVFEKELAGTPCIFAANGERSLCSFSRNGDRYEIYGSISVEQTEILVRSMLEGKE